MNVTATPSSNDIAGQSLENLAKDPSISDTTKLKRVSEEFEAYLLRTFLTEARKPMVQSKCNPDAAGQDIYQSMVTGQIADSVSKSGTLGLADIMRQQLEHQALRGTAGGVPAANGTETKE